MCGEISEEERARPGEVLTINLTIKHLRSVLLSSGGEEGGAQQQVAARSQWCNV